MSPPASRVLLRGGHVYTPVDPFATAMLVVDGDIAWIGGDAGADVHRDSAEVVIELDGALVTPAFVDAHVHATLTGLGITGVDLTGARGARDVLDAVAAAARSDRPIVLGHGWDDTNWPDPQLPSRMELEAAAGGRPTYLSRIDVHSALVAGPLVDGALPQGPVTRVDHQRCRTAALGLVTPAMREEAQRATLALAAARGIASLHELSGPGIGGADDLAGLLALAHEPGLPEVIGYWGEIGGARLARRLGARGAAGDLFVDGALGSHTACLREPYSDSPDSHGASYLDSGAIADHVRECTEAGLQAGFHVIGDAAADIAFEGFAMAAQSLGVEALTRSRHRLEHLEMLDDAHVQALAELSIVASVQPAFDAAWGGPDGMYERRLGVDRARRMNAYADLAARGITLAFGSDAPVTPLDPWGTVRAAVFHHRPEQRLSARAAFLAHTRGGRRAALQESIEPGVLREGARATYAVWEPGTLVVQAPDDRIAAWSTDPRSATPGLPDLTPGRALPDCWQTVRRGVVIHDAGALEGGSP